MMHTTNSIRKNTIVKDLSHQHYQEEDDKDFDVKTIKSERLIDSVPGLDEEFDRDMYNFGDEEDLPDSDREAGCKDAGISRKHCFNR